MRFTILLLILLILKLSFSKSDQEVQRLLEEKNNYFYENIHTIKLEGNSTLMYYYVNIFVGTPPQRQTLIVDTGSYLMAFPCSECKGNCGKHIDKQFQKHLSISFKEVVCNEQIGNYKCTSCNQQKNQCTWSISYAEGSSLRGHLIKDYVTLGDDVQSYIDESKIYNKDLLKYINHQKIEMVLGCTEQETNLFLTQDADGIIGLSPGTDSVRHLPNIVDENFKQHRNNNESLVFSLCLGSGDGGYMSIGGYNTQRHLPGAQTKIVNYNDDDGFYNIEILGMKIGDEDMKFTKTDFRNPFIDSGTTLFFGPRSLIESMNNKILSLCGQNGKCKGDYKEYKYKNSQNQHCWIFNPQKASSLEDFLDSFPDISFQLQGFDFIWNGRNYLFLDPEHLKQPNTYCFAFEAYNTQRIYLGGSWMREYDILFDRTKKQIHFTRSLCSQTYPGLKSISQLGEEIITTQSDEELIKKLGQDDSIIMKLVIGIGLAFLFIIMIFRWCQKREKKQSYQITNNNQNEEDGLQSDHKKIDMTHYDEDLQSEEQNQYGYQNQDVELPENEKEEEQDDGQSDEDMDQQNKNLKSDQQQFDHQNVNRHQIESEEKMRVQAFQD